ncbi:MAG TPA: hypothetical protein VHU87_09750 [Rhizomicrobium sp.]|jgi:hypothetical protein|nr:hypothetical protein [Rhizomicrobium sp.]
MQIGANSLLIAAQQARTAPQPAKPAAASFEPLPLKQTAQAPAQTSQPATPMRPGSQLDIRV